MFREFWRRFRRLAALLLVVLNAGYGTGCGSLPTSPFVPLKGGVVVTFEVGEERFKVFVTNPVAIDQLIALKNGTGTATIPNGRIHRGQGAGRHNAPFSWHLDPAEIEMAAQTVEVCDGAPSYVQRHVNDYVDVVKRYCPWGARLVELVDLR